MLRILMVGDVFGRPGREAVEALVPALRREHGVDLCVVNGENAAGGRGLTRDTAASLQRAGADVITLGDHVWDQKETAALLDENPRILRPANYPDGNPGSGAAVVPAGPCRVGILNLVGRVFMGPSDCPFRTAERMLEGPLREAQAVLVEIHAEATSEKAAMGWFLDGRVAAVVGSHTHVQTADERVLPGGTAYLTDLGMAGPRDSVIGCRTDAILGRFLTLRPARHTVAEGNVWLSGALIEVEESTGRARSIRRLNLPWAGIPAPPDPEDEA